MMKIVGLGLTVLGLVLTIVGTSLPSWGTQEQPSPAHNNPTTFGLNSLCYYDGTAMECLTYSDWIDKFTPATDKVGAWLTVSMAFAIMAILALTVATMAMAGHAKMKMDKLKKPALGAAGFGILCQLIAIAVFAYGFTAEDDKETADVIEGFYDPTAEDIKVGMAMVMVIVGMLLNVAGLGVYAVMGKNPAPLLAVHPGV